MSKRIILSLISIIVVAILAVSAFACTKDDNKKPDQPKEEKKNISLPTQKFDASKQNNLVNNGYFTIVDGAGESSTLPFKTKDWSADNYEKTFWGIVSNDSDFVKNNKSKWGNIEIPKSSITDKSSMLMINTMEKGKSEILTLNSIDQLFSIPRSTTYEIKIKYSVHNLKDDAKLSFKIRTNSFTKTFSIDKVSENKKWNEIKFTIKNNDYSASAVKFIIQQNGQCVSFVDYITAFESNTPNLYDLDIQNPDPLFDISAEITKDSEYKNFISLESFPDGASNNFSHAYVNLSSAENNLLAKMNSEQKFNKHKLTDTELNDFIENNKAKKGIFAILAKDTVNINVKTKNDLYIAAGKKYKLSIEIYKAENIAPSIILTKDPQNHNKYETVLATDADNGKWVTKEIIIEGSDLYVTKLNTKIKLNIKDANTKARIFAISKFELNEVDGSIATTYSTPKASFYLQETTSEYIQENDSNTGIDNSSVTISNGLVEKLFGSDVKISKINHTKPNASKFIAKEFLTVPSNSIKGFILYVKTSGLNSDQNLTITINANEESKISSSDVNVNTEKSHSYKLSNGYQSLLFIVSAGNNEAKLNIVAKLGSGTQLDPNTLVKGAAFISKALSFDLKEYEKYTINNELSMFTIKEMSAASDINKNDTFLDKNDNLALSDIYKNALSDNTIATITDSTYGKLKEGNNVVQQSTFFTINGLHLYKSIAPITNTTASSNLPNDWSAEPSTIKMHNLASVEFKNEFTTFSSLPADIQSKITNGISNAVVLNKANDTLISPDITLNAGKYYKLTISYLSQNGSNAQFILKRNNIETTYNLITRELNTDEIYTNKAVFLIKSPSNVRDYKINAKFKTLADDKLVFINGFVIEESNQSTYDKFVEYNADGNTVYNNKETYRYIKSDDIADDISIGVIHPDASIINGLAGDYSDTKYNSGVFKMAITSNNNFYAITAKSTNINFAANSYYRLDVPFKTSADAKIDIVLANADNAANASKIYRVNGKDNANWAHTSTEWKYVTFLINTGVDSLDYRLHITLGAKATDPTDKRYDTAITGSVYIDNILQTKGLSKEQFEALQGLNFNTDSFNINATDGTSNKYYNNGTFGYTTNNWNINDSDSEHKKSVYGIYDLSKADNIQSLGLNSLDSLEAIKAQAFALVIKNNQNNKVSFNKSFSLQEKQFYRVSLKALSTIDNAYITFVSDGPRSFGKVAKPTDKPKKLNLNKFDTYTFVIEVKEGAGQSAELKFGMGENDSNSIGAIIIDDITIEQIDSTVYNAQNDNATSTKITLSKATEQNNKQDNNNNNKKNERPRDRYLWAYISGAIISIALIVIIIVYIIKVYYGKLKKKQSFKKSSNNRTNAKKETVSKKSSNRDKFSK